MSKRFKIIIAVVVFIIAVVVFILWWWLSRFGESPAPILTNNTPPGLEVPAILPASSGGLPRTGELAGEEPDLQTTLKAIAFTFAERFGSYSNEVYFSNFDDLADLMTAKMKIWVQNYKTTQQAADNSEYYGISTKAVAAEITEFDEALRRAEVAVNTQRQESRISSSNPRVFYQKLKLSIVEVDGAWKIDEAEWQ